MRYVQTVDENRKLDSPNFKTLLPKLENQKPVFSPFRLCIERKKNPKAR